MKDVDFPAALEIMTHPHDLSFAISGKDFIITRGPSGDGRILISSEDLSDRIIEDPVDCIEKLLESFAKTVEKELRHGGSFCDLIQTTDRPWDDPIILKDEDIDKITRKLREDSPNGVVETYLMNF